MQDLVILIGASGSGKSYWCQAHEDIHHMWISRDEIREEIYAEINESLTQHNFYRYEKVVKQRFYDSIARALGMGYSVFADATHTTIRSRSDLMAKVTESYMRNFPNKEKNWRTVAMYIKADLNTCLEGNAEREGVSNLQYKDLEDIYYSLMPPSNKEKFDAIFVVDREKGVGEV